MENALNVTKYKQNMHTHVCIVVGDYINTMRTTFDLKFGFKSIC